MKVGDLVQHFLTEQVGIIVQYAPSTQSFQVLWTTQGLSMWMNNKEWCGGASLEVVSES